MSPAELLNNPHTQQAKQWLSMAIEQHLATGESLDTILGLSSSGFSAVQARTTHLRKIKGEQILSLYLDYQQGGLSPREASNAVFKIITDRTGPVDVQPLVAAVCALDYAPKSSDYFYQNLRNIELQISQVLIAG